jgi:hypothetical protein
MAKERKRLALDALKRATDAVAAAKDVVLNKSALDALMNTKPEDLIAPDSDAEVIKGRAKRSGCWAHSPAMLDLFAAADKRLTRVANWAGMNVKRVEKVHARLIPGTKLVIIKAAPVEDLTAIPVNRYGTAVTINLISLLAEHGLTVETGYRERYDVAYIPRESPHWPGLVIDLTDVKERRLESESKKEKGAPPPGEL